LEPGVKSWVSNVRFVEMGSVNPGTGKVNNWLRRCHNLLMREDGIKIRGTMVKRESPDWSTGEKEEPGHKRSSRGVEAQRKNKGYRERGRA